MLKQPREYFSRDPVRISIDAQGKEVTFRQLIAVLVLFSAAAHIDGIFIEKELVAILDIIVEEFKVSEEYAKELLEIAEYLLLDQKNLRKYADVVNESYNKEQKRRVFDLVIAITAVDGGPQEQEAILRQRIKYLFDLDE